MKYLYKDERGDAAGGGMAMTLITTIALILIAVYILTMIVGGISLSTESNPAINQSSAWGSTFDSMDRSGGSSMSLASMLPIILVGIGVMTFVMAAFKMKG